MDASQKLKEKNSIALKNLLEPNTKVIVTKGIAEKPKKPRRRDKSDLGEHFIAPDGGVWAWLVCIAAGVSNLSIYPCLQQFGFIFRDRLEYLGMSSSQVSTIINTNQAVSACSGLLNGPMFRRFSYRQVGIMGSLFIFLGISLTAFCKSFIGYILAYSVLYGFGLGITVSATALALNTYFKNKRRRATGFAWTITGLGPIFLPHVITFLLTVYEVYETVLIFAAFSLHSLVSAMIYQPAQYHSPSTVPDQSTTNEEDNVPTASPEATQHMCKFCDLQQRRQHGIFSSQYLYQEDDENMPGYEIIDPGTPMLSRANDGWFGSKISLASMDNVVRFRKISSSKDIENGLVPRLNKVSEEEGEPSEDFFKPNYFKRERDEAIKRSNSKAQFSRENSTGVLHCTCAEERALLELQSSVPGHEIFESKIPKQKDITPPSEISFIQKVIIFFDLSLLRDFTYLNLVVAMTMINFGELNFSILAPLILRDFGFDSKQVTFAMSLLGLMDLIMRFLVPFLTEKISWDNRVFFLIGVVGIALGRTVVACTRSYKVILISFTFIGIFKGIRTIFWPLIIPSYVPLKRLPAASGLQLLMCGLFSLACGPFVGIIRDRYDYSTTVHCLNFLTFSAAGSWCLEALVRRYIRKRSEKK